MDSPHKSRICISVCEPTIPALERAIITAARACDLIEVRLDCLNALELAADAASVTRLLKDADCESILTLRPTEQGGLRSLDDETRQAFWSDAIFSDSFFDVELDLAERFSVTENPSSLPIDWSRTICSYHDFTGVPAKLAQIYDRLAATPARVLKIAVQANDATDCLPVFQLLARARAEGREIIAIAMGTPGIATRILGPARGAFLTYAARENEMPTAPGQISVNELKEVYRLEAIDPQTQVFGLIGLPVGHSVSPQMHNAAFAAIAANAVYIPFEVDDVSAFIKRMIHPRTRELDWNLSGLSITAPHKSAARAQLDWIDPIAAAVGAVNTILLINEELHGYNTDVSGFRKPLEKRIGSLRGVRCAVIGAGGAASAALLSLQQAGAIVTLLSRDIARGSELAKTFGASSGKLEGAGFGEFEVVINATPLGTAGKYEAETPARAEQLRGTRLVYDLVYNPTETRFLREANEAGCETLGGLEMLVAQAAAQFELWTGVAPPVDVMLHAAKRGLNKSC